MSTVSKSKRPQKSSRRPRAAAEEPAVMDVEDKQVAKKRVGRKQKESESESVSVEVSEPALTEVASAVDVSEPASEATSEVVEVAVGGKKKKLKLNREQVGVKFEELLISINEELEKTKENKKRDVPPATWKKLLQLTKKVKASTLPSVRKKIAVSNNNRTGGFDKPKRISTEMIEFTGWDPEDRYSQNDVTVFLCNYIKEKGLQNPENRKNILLDKPLMDLLRPNEVLTPENSDKIYYFTLQQLIKPHLLKE